MQAILLPLQISHRRGLQLKFYCEIEKRKPLEPGKKTNSEIWANIEYNSEVREM